MAGKCNVGIICSKLSKKVKEFLYQFLKQTLHLMIFEL